MRVHISALLAAVLLLGALQIGAGEPQVAELEGDAPNAAEQMIQESPGNVEQLHVTVEAAEPATVPAQQQQQQQDLAEQQDHRGLQKEEQALLEIPQAAEQSQQAAVASAAGDDSFSPSGAEAAAQQANKAAEQPQHETEEAAALRRQQEEQAAVAAAAAAEAERAAEAVRMQRYDEAKAEVQRAESLVGWALDDDDVDVAAGLGLLQGLFARLDAHIDAALGESVSRRRLYTPPPPLPAPPAEQQQQAGDAAAEQVAGGEQADTSSSLTAAANDGHSSDARAVTANVSAAAGAVVRPTLEPQDYPELAPLSDAAFTLAALLSSGIASEHGLPRNDSAAVYALHRAALAGSVEARLALAERYTVGRGVPRLLEEGLAHAKVAGPQLLALLDEAGVINSEGGGHLRRKWMDASYLPAANIWEDSNTLHLEQDAAARGDVQAHRQLGYRQLMGQGLPRDHAAAYREFQLAARAGDAFAEYNLGFMHIRGWHVEQDYGMARHHFLAAAAGGLPTAFNGLGVLFYHGQGVEVNLTEAFRYFKLGSLVDHDAAYNLGNMYQGAFAVEQNMTMAVELFENATRMGSWRAPHQLFLIYADGLFSVPKNGSLALHYFRLFLDLTGGWREGGKAAADRAAEHDLWGAAVRYALLAEQGNWLAQLNLAWLLHRGGVVEGGVRHRLALPFWLRAVEANQTEGMLMAAHTLRRGSQLGLEGGTDLPQAVELYRQAAAAGSIEGLYSMAQLHEQGLGVQRNVTEAIRLYRQAVRTAPFEQYGMAPFLALWWLRTRLLLQPLLRPLLRLLAACLSSPPLAGSRGRAGLAGGVAAQTHTSAGPWRQRYPAVPQLDTLLIALLAGMLTWVLWRRRQIRGQLTAPSTPPSATALPESNSAQRRAAGHPPSMQAAPVASAAAAAGLRQRSASRGGNDLEGEQAAARDAPPNARL